MLDYPLANGLRFPPYCSHKLQSLDQLVYSLFKSIITVCMTTGCLTIPGEHGKCTLTQKEGAVSRKHVFSKTSPTFMIFMELNSIMCHGYLYGYV